MDILIGLLQGNKFDTGDKLWPFLLFGLVMMPLVIFTWKKMKRSVSVFEIITLGGFLAFSWISFLASQTKNFGFSEVFVVTSCVVLYLVFAQLKKEKTVLFMLLTLLALLASAFGIYYFLSEFEPRIAGIFFDPMKRAHFFPNAFALFLIMTWPIALIISMSARKWLRPVLLGILLSALILTYSRGAWITLVIQIGLTGIYFLWQKKFRKPFLKFSALVLLATFLITSGALAIRSQEFPTKSLRERASVPTLEKRTSISERFEFFEGAATLAAKEPLTGYGPMSFGYVYRGIQKNLFSISDHPHNVFLKIAAENGIPAVIFLVAFFGYLAWLFKKSYRHLEDHEQPIAFLLFIALLGGIIHNLVDYNFNFLLNIGIFWVLLGIFRAHLFTHETKEKLTGKVFALLLTLPLVILGSLEISHVYALKSNTPEGKEKYEETLFPRWFFVSEAREAMKKKNWDEALHMLMHELARNPYDAEAWSLRGEAVREKGNPKEALSMYQKALALDPKNTFLYYRQVLETSRRLGIKTKELEATALKLLDEYVPLLKENAHFTAFTDNPEQAAFIASFLGKTKLAQEIRNLAKTVKAQVTSEQKLEWSPPFQ